MVRSQIPDSACASQSPLVALYTSLAGAGGVPTWRDELAAPKGSNGVDLSGSSEVKSGWILCWLISRAKELRIVSVLIQ